MKVSPNSTVTLYSGVDITPGVQVIFGSRAAQQSYFASRQAFSGLTVNKKFTYLRRGGKLKLQVSTANVSQCDYMSFRNPAFEDREFYAKIVNYEYINNVTTEITYAMDDFQTYMFDVHYEFGYIEREHLSESDYQKSVSNPYDPTIYEFSTAETLPSSKEMEIVYTDVVNYPNNLDGANLKSCVIMQVATFDASQFPNIGTDFYSIFDNIVMPNGVVTSGNQAIGYKVINVERGYMLCVIRLDNLTHIFGETKLQQAIDWLTLQGLDGQIINIFQIGAVAWDKYISNTESFSPVVPRSYDVENKKLMLSPYQYIRVYNNEGDCKEYKYEMFEELRSGTRGAVQFQFFALFDGSPMTSMVPLNYRRTGLNQEERIDCHQIPQVGYATDSYLAFLASQYNMNLASRTDTVGESLNDVVDKGIGWLRNKESEGSAIAGLGADVVSAIQGSANTLIPAAAGAIASASYGNVAGAVGSAAGALGGISNTSIREEANNYRSGNNAVSEYFAPAKSAFVADNYHAGSTNGTLGYYMDDNKYAPGTFSIVRVGLRDDVLKVFDDYFSGYGYTSGRLGKPRVCSYIEGSSVNTPHFANYNGKSVTYVKTNNMHVDHTLASVSASIEDMFNTGCQFLKGEDL